MWEGEGQRVKMSAQKGDSNAGKRDGNALWLLRLP